jgi:hypothetical protein
VCRCRRGYASEYDGKCSTCRGCTAWEQRQKDLDTALLLSRMEKVADRLRLTRELAEARGKLSAP